MGTSRICVIQVVDSLPRGGMERVAVILANGLARLGCDSHIVSSRSYGSLEEEIDPSVKSWCAGRTSRYDLKGIRRIARYVDDNGIQVIHSHNHRSSYLIRVVLWFVKSRPVHVVHDHSGPGLCNRRKGLLDWLMLRHVDAYLAVSEAIRDRASRLLSLPEGRCLYLRNGVVLPPEAPPHCGRPTVIQAACLDGPKDHTTAVRAAHIIRKEFPDLRWCCAGKITDPPTPYLQKLQGIIESLGMQGCFELMGECSDVSALLREGNVGVLTSIAEGLPMAVLEYMATGLPVVMTDVGQAPAILRSGNAGLVARPGDPEGIARAILTILKDPALAARLGRAGRQYVGDHYTADRMVEEVYSLYATLLAGKDNAASHAVRQER